MDLDPLTRLAIRHGTDKFGFHDYTPRYHKLFARFRDRPLRLLEIGVGGYQDEDRGGQSLAVWRDYFPQGEITGIDIQKKVLDLGPRVRILQGSQVDADFLARVVADRGPFDLIIDDGSHRNEHVVESWRLLWPTLAPGGVYVAEDVQTAFMPRFGGSLTLDAPNTVGFFADVTERLGRDDPDIAEAVAVERFHNMIALHKAGPASWPGIAGSNALDALPPDARIAVAGGPALPGRLSEARPMTPGAAPDALILHAATPEGVGAALEAMGAAGVLLLPGPLSADMRAYLTARFVEVDHREIAVTYPRAPVGPHARVIAGIECHRDGAIIIKGPNDWPSNFAFDPDHPQAAAAIAAIATTLETDGAEENGYLAFANMLSTVRGRDAARPWLARLGAVGSRARTYFQLAGGLAQQDRGFAEAAALFADGLAAFPGDAQFALNLGSAELALGNVDAAARATQAGLDAHPRDVNLLLLMGRIAARQGDHGQAVNMAERAVAAAPPTRRARAQAALGEALVAAGRSAEAEGALRAALADGGRDAAFARTWRALSAVLSEQGAAEEARAAAEKAVELSPRTREYRDWQARLSA